jgi:hypothetical protein
MKIKLICDILSQEWSVNAENDQKQQRTGQLARVVAVVQIDKKSGGDALRLRNKNIRYKWNS